MGKQTKPRLIITDHAILRYLERVKGLDVEAIKEEMLPQPEERAIVSIGNCVYPVRDSHRLRAHDGKIITTLPYHKT